MKEAPGPWFPASLAAAHRRLVNGDQSGLVTAAAAEIHTSADVSAVFDKVGNGEYNKLSPPDIETPVLQTSTVH